MNRYIYIIVLVLFYVDASYTQTVISNLSDLDNLVKQEEQFSQRRSRKIDSLKQVLYKEVNVTKKSSVMGDIIQEYVSFQADSALLYIDRNNYLLADNPNFEQKISNQFHYIRVCMKLGMFSEAKNSLDVLNREVHKMNNSLFIDFLRLSEQMYAEMKDFASSTPYLYESYDVLEQKYCDSLLLVSLQEPDIGAFYKAKKQLLQGAFLDAERTLHELITRTDFVSVNAVDVYYLAGLIAIGNNEPENAKQNLIKASAILIEKGDYPNEALFALLSLLFKEGDTKRANAYLEFYTKQCVFFNTPTKYIKIFKVDPSNSFLGQKDEIYKIKNGYYPFLMLAIVLLFVCVVVAIIFFFKQKRTRPEFLPIALNTDSQVEDMLDSKKENLFVLQPLEPPVAQVLNVDRRLLELYTGYILQILNFRKNVNQRLKSTEMNSSSLFFFENESKDFYQKFDELFLSFYPSFVNDFNCLLKDEQQIVLKGGELLNAELRIFALIILGVKESSQIADFLGYAPVTIYTYKTKIKSRAKDKKNFDANFQKMSVKLSIDPSIYDIRQVGRIS